MRHRGGFAGQNIQLLWEQTEFDFTVRQCPASDENSAGPVPVIHNILSDGDVKGCVSCDGT